MGRADLRPSNLHFSCHVGHARARFLLAVCACFLSIPEYSKFVLRLINQNQHSFALVFYTYSSVLSRFLYRGFHWLVRHFAYLARWVKYTRPPWCLFKPEGLQRKCRSSFQRFQASRRRKRPFLYHYGITYRPWCWRLNLFLILFVYSILMWLRTWANFNAQIIMTLLLLNRRLL